MCRSIAVALMRHTVQEAKWDGDINPYLGHGLAGSVLALAELIAALDLEQYRPQLLEASDALRRRRQLPGPRLSGLLAGDAGIGLALLRCGQLLGDSTLTRAAAEISESIACRPYNSPDVYTGTAGRLQFHLAVLAERSDRTHLDAALRAGNNLLTTAEVVEGRGRHWPFPPQYLDLAGKQWLGYAHGAAGIADSLLSLFRVTGEERWLEPVSAACDLLQSAATWAGGRLRFVDWPPYLGGTPGGPRWCHGATGIGRFLMNVEQLSALPRPTTDLLSACIRSAAASRWLGPCACHGLAGAIELLADMHAWTGNRRHLAEAHDLARIVSLYEIDWYGVQVPVGEDRVIPGPQLLTGYAGIALALLRLARPERTQRALP
jgi:lantibiotic modifying enzyme